MDKNQVKKSVRANLEKQKSTYLLMGVVLGVSFLFFAFEWSTETRKLDKSIFITDIFVDEEIVLTRREPTPPPPPPPPQPDAPEEIEVVEVEVHTTMIIDSEDNPSRPQDVGYMLPTLPKPEPEPEAKDEIFVVAEEFPEFPGGQVALMKFLSDNIRYPVIAQENDIQGRVICSFVVEKDGSITDVQVVRGVDPSLDREAVRVIGQMPHWKPGKQRMNPVRFRYTLPVVFRLQKQ